MSSGMQVVRAPGTLILISGGDYVSASSSPGVNNDGVDTAGLGASFNVGNFWTRADINFSWRCVDNATGAAVWEPVRKLPQRAEGLTSVAVTGSGNADVTGAAITFTAGPLGIVDIIASVCLGADTTNWSSGVLRYIVDAGAAVTMGYAGVVSSVSLQTLTGIGTITGLTPGTSYTVKLNVAEGNGYAIHVRGDYAPSTIKIEVS